MNLGLFSLISICSKRRASTSFFVVNVSIWSVNFFIWEVFLSFKYYFSNENKKNSYRSLKNIEDKTENYSRNLILLKSDTVNIVEYVEKSIDKNKKNYKFWELINNDG